MEALRVIELPRHEYLLVFSTLAAYVDRHGRRSREREIMYPALPTAIGTSKKMRLFIKVLAVGYIFIYTFFRLS